MEFEKNLGNLVEKKESRGRTINLVMLHNFEFDKNTGELKMPREKLEELTESISKKSGIVKFYTGTLKQGDSTPERIPKTLAIIIDQMKKHGIEVRPTRERKQLERMPGTPDYYAFLAKKAQGENSSLNDKNTVEILQSIGPALYDLWARHPDPQKNITTADESIFKLKKMVQTIKGIAERSPANFPDATVVMIVDRQVQAWLTQQTGIPSEELGIITDDEPIGMTFSGNKEEKVKFSFKGKEYNLNL